MQGFQGGEKKSSPEITVRKGFPSAWGVFSKLIGRLYVRVPVGGLGVDGIRQQLFRAARMKQKKRHFTQPDKMTKKTIRTCGHTYLLYKEEL